MQKRDTASEVLFSYELWTMGYELKDKPQQIF